jgi:cellulose synthase/poly-beta-1,6-N-acetylglucosamine synthase-like glycosyltransferase
MSLKISVIIPVYNDPGGLRDTLESLVAQDFPRSRFEIIVVDNGSTDLTHQVASDFATNYPEIMRVVVEDSIQSSYAARNKGIDLSFGEIMCFIDADMTVDKDWLRNVERLLAEKRINYVGFRVEITVNKKTVVALYNQMNGFPVEYYVKDTGFAPTCCLAVRRDLFRKVGLFNPRLVSSGDLEFGNRVKQAGFSLWYEPNIIMYHPARTTIRSFIKKSLRIGRGIYQLSTLYPDRYSGIQSRLVSRRPRSARTPTNTAAYKQTGLTMKMAFYFLTLVNIIALGLGYLLEQWRMRRTSNNKEHPGIV